MAVTAVLPANYRTGYGAQGDDDCKPKPDSKVNKKIKPPTLPESATLLDLLADGSIERDDDSDTAEDVLHVTTEIERENLGADFRSTDWVPPEYEEVGVFMCAHAYRANYTL